MLKGFDTSSYLKCPLLITNITLPYKCIFITIIVQVTEIHCTLNYFKLTKIYHVFLYLNNLFKSFTILNESVKCFTYFHFFVIRQRFFPKCIKCTSIVFKCSKLKD